MRLIAAILLFIVSVVISVFVVVTVSVLITIMMILFRRSHGSDLQLPLLERLSCGEGYGEDAHNLKGTNHNIRAVAVWCNNQLRQCSNAIFTI